MVKTSFLREKKITPLLKWPGGKGSELEKPELQALFPSQIKTYYEPFVGGAACYFAVDFENAFINDKCPELIAFYEIIAEQNKKFFAAIQSLTTCWVQLEELIKTSAAELTSAYKTKNDKEISSIVEKSPSLKPALKAFPSFLPGYVLQVIASLNSKIKRMRTLETSKGTLSDEDILLNIECGLKGGLYTHVRSLFNSAKCSKELHIALFIFLRDYCYSAMFRYNDKGEFNVPYGGISYNSRRPDAKMDLWKSPDVINHLSKTTLGSSDFEAFLTTYPPKKDDFVFLDPPYDTEFSTYAKNSFDKQDQERLANWLINLCQANWMLVIKSTPFILGLYENNPSINIASFDKRYAVSFKGRNNPDCSHLVIYNYTP